MNFQRNKVPGHYPSDVFGAFLTAMLWEVLNITRQHIGATISIALAILKSSNNDMKDTEKQTTNSIYNNPYLFSYLLPLL